MQIQEDNVMVGFLIVLGQVFQVVKSTPIALQYQTMMQSTTSGAINCLNTLIINFKQAIT
jgi:hypothetical protein